MAFGAAPLESATTRRSSSRKGRVMNIGLFLRVLQMLGFVLMGVFQAEEAEGAGKGPDKRARVEKDAHAAIRRFTTDTPFQACAPDRLAAIIGALIDNTVALLNCLGVFSSSK